MKLNKQQEEIFYGIILGDLHVTRYYRKIDKGISYRLYFEQGNNHKDYLQHLYKVYGKLVKTPPKQKTNGNWYFHTLTLRDAAICEKLYRNNVKRIPSDLFDHLTPLGLAYWFMDDGSIKSKESKGVYLNTQSFTHKEVLFLCNGLKRKFNLNVWPSPCYEKGNLHYTKKNILYYQTYISGHSYEILRDLIYNYIVPSMQYKFPCKRKI